MALLFNVIKSRNWLKDSRELPEQRADHSGRSVFLGFSCSAFFCSLEQSLNSFDGLLLFTHLLFPSFKTASMAARSRTLIASSCFRQLIWRRRIRSRSLRVFPMYRKS